MKQNSEYRAEARHALEGKWGDAAIITVVAVVITAFLNYGFQFGGQTASGSEVVGSGCSLIGEILYLPVAFAMTVTFLRLFRNQEVGIKDLFAYFSGRVFLTMLLKYIYQILWTLLLIIPGIIKFYSYSMTEYIMLDDPNIDGNDAIEKSMRMMKGKKMKLFLLDLSFLGWAILCVLTLGLGIILLQPYMYTARAAFYEDLKAETEWTV